MFSRFNWLHVSISAIFYGGIGCKMKKQQNMIYNIAINHAFLDY